MGVEINGHRWKQHDAKSVFLPYDKMEKNKYIKIFDVRVWLGNDRLVASCDCGINQAVMKMSEPHELNSQETAVIKALGRLTQGGATNAYAIAHATLTLEAFETMAKRKKLITQGKLKPLPEKSQRAADQIYVDTAKKLYDGFDKYVLPLEKPDAK